MLKRRRYDDLVAWKNLKTQQGMLVVGARQVGKTTLVREFARNHYRRVAEVSFLGNAELPIRACLCAPRGQRAGGRRR